MLLLTFSQTSPYKEVPEKKKPLVTYDKLLDSPFKMLCIPL